MASIRLKDGSVRSFARTEIMGIVNVTPDSFYEASRADGQQAPSLGDGEGPSRRIVGEGRLGARAFGM